MLRCRSETIAAGRMGVGHLVDPVCRLCNDRIENRVNEQLARLHHKMPMKDRRISLFLLTVTNLITPARAHQAAYWSNMDSIEYGVMIVLPKPRSSFSITESSLPFAGAGLTVPSSRSLLAWLASTASQGFSRYSNATPAKRFRI